MLLAVLGLALQAVDGGKGKIAMADFVIFEGDRCACGAARRGCGGKGHEAFKLGVAAQSGVIGPARMAGIGRKTLS